MKDINENNARGELPLERYRAMILRVYSSPRTVLLLKCVSGGGVVISAFAFILRICLFAVYSQLVLAFKIAAVAAVPFIAVSVLRKIINAKRPYELIGDFPERPKDKSGESFPSRHT